MSHILEFTARAKEDIQFFKSTGNKNVLKKLYLLLNEISEKPYFGTGKPEALKFDLTGLWSRRITREHRIVYELRDDKIMIHSVKGHYY